MLGKVNSTIDIQFHNLIGSFTIPSYSYNADKNILLIRKNASEIFYQTDKNKVTIPNITEGRDSFMITVQDKNGININGFVARVDSIRRYTCAPIYNDDDSTVAVDYSVELEFSYTVAWMDRFDMASMICINPVLSHILVDDDYIALYVEGDEKEDISSSYKIFSHGRSIYQCKEVLNFRSVPMKMRTDASVSKLHYCYIVLGFNTKSPLIRSEESFEKFKSNALAYANDIYGVVSDAWGLNKA